MWKKTAKRSNVGRNVRGVVAERKHLLHVAWERCQTARAKQQACKQEEHPHVATVRGARWLGIKFEQFLESGCWHYRFQSQEMPL